MIIETNIVFGKKYKDKNTGLVGIATAIAKHQYGCIRVSLQPPAKEDGTVPDNQWFDEEGIEGVEPVERATGGPTKAPRLHNSMPR